MKKILIIGLACVIFLAAGAAILGYLIFLQPQSESTASEKQVIIPPGSSITEIAAILRRSALVRRPQFFIFAARLSGDDKHLKAGKFSLPGGANNRELLKILSSGHKQVHEKITIPEGITSRRIASLFARQADIDSVEFVTLVSDSGFVQALGIEAPSLEGYLFPETYYLPWGITSREAIAFMVDHFNNQLPDSAESKARLLGLSLHEIVTLASIIEGEAMVDAERRTIAAVYHNRLRKGIRLQADPTIQYIIPDGPRRLLNADLQIDSPYNSYLYAGLPPGPINNPGQKSLEAALNPLDVPYLYMVARGDGSHIFSTTLAEHNKAHRAFNRYRREVARKKKQKAGNGGNGKK
ncbi:MAG: endolytic transglycosylase MltG [bacterium]